MLNVKYHSPYHIITCPFICVYALSTERVECRDLEISKVVNF